MRADEWGVGRMGGVLERVNVADKGSWMKLWPRESNGVDGVTVG